MKSVGLMKFSGMSFGLLLFSLSMSAGASAQYGGGMGGTGTGSTGSGSTGSTSAYSSGSGKAIGIGVGAAAGAAVGIGLLVHHHRVVAARNQASLIGCTQSVLNGISLKNETDDLTYRIVSGSTSLQPGERVEVRGAMASQGSEAPAFHVQSLVKNYGTCGSAFAAAKSPEGKNATAQLAK
ncbi:MAG TPA: hypothetical protein VGF19_05380 [Candidatus Acidoferrum sp.]